MSNSIQVTLMGINTPHEPDFILDRPAGFHAYVLLCFMTPFVARTAQGMEQGRIGDCLLHDPSFGEYHRSAPGMTDGFRNIWFHLSGEQVPLLAEQYDVPFNEIISTGDPGWLLPTARALEHELFHRKPYTVERITLLVEDLFLQLGRQKKLTQELESYTPLEKELRYKFTEIRAQVHSEYQEPWNVERMAKLVNLSPERFWVLYQKFFKASPKDDLITKRLEEAKVLLISSSRSIEQVALDCGFNSVFYFSRIFKKRNGYSPSVFRKNLGNYDKAGPLE
ncbi:helix-turn-helix transcriptional regulator [Paenibacillus shunpengii]|uniref:Helix-turn-helix transcriptional regulator n=1 Tax=Paenibacillus shunpengii TaxID=2054424 RepID=A0ABW5SQ18_9BACL|nr:AraC family transcriptional regulator [Paenibacillus sp. PDC88]SDX19952.1 AraC-type DNA-binding protein [Paenibacillus sp. PDC88]